MAVTTTVALILAGSAVASAGGAAYAAKQGSNASKRATDAQTRATDQALQFERDRASKEDARYEQREAAYQRDLAEWKARRGYGAGQKPGANDVRSQPASQGLMGLAPIGATRALPTIRDLGAMGLGTPETAAQPAGTIADPGQWNDWEQYLRPGQTA